MSDQVAAAISLLNRMACSTTPESCEIGTSTKHARCQPFIQVIASGACLLFQMRTDSVCKIVINCNRGRLVSYFGGRSGGWVPLIKQWLSIVLQCTPAIVQQDLYHFDGAS